MDVYGFVSRLLVLAVVVSAVLFAVCRPPQPAESGETDPAVAVAARSIDQGTQFANIVISSENKVSLDRAWLLVNGEVRGSFASGELLVRVYDGDILALDCRAYGRELRFTAEALSSSVDERYLPSSFTCREEVAVFGFAVIP